MFGKDEVLKVKMKKGRGPIRKVRVAAYAGGIALVISPFVDPLLVRFLGYVPEGIVNKIVETLMVNYELITALIAAYQARPDPDDEPVVA